MDSIFKIRKSSWYRNSLFGPGKKIARRTNVLFVQSSIATAALDLIWISRVENSLDAKIKKTSVGEQLENELQVLFSDPEIEN